jgi:hypothetical protein
LTRSGSLTTGWARGWRHPCHCSCVGAWKSLGVTVSRTIAADVSVLAGDLEAVARWVPARPAWRSEQHISESLVWRCDGKLPDQGPEIGGHDVRTLHRPTENALDRSST